MREVILDTETTGLEVEKGDRVIEVGCVALRDGVEEGRFHAYVNPERPVGDSEKVHGLSDEFLEDKPSFKEIAPSFLEFIGGDKLVIHNAPFDMGFLNAELERIGMPPLASSQAVDTLAMARRKWPGASNSLDALCKRFDIDTSVRRKHGALLDARLLAEVYAHLIGRKIQESFDLSPQKDSAKDSAKDSPKDSAMETRHVPSPASSASQTKRLRRPPSEEELAQHRHLLATFSALPLWARFAKDAKSARKTKRAPTKTEPRT